MLTKSELCAELSEMGLGGKTQIRNILDGLAEIAEDEIANGEDFTVPGICRLAWTYRKPQAKGARWKKGEEVVGFGGVATVKDSDSPAVKAQARLKAYPTGATARGKPSTKPEAQAAFLKSKAGKNVASRKGK